MSFIGAAIGTAVGIGGAVISGNAAGSAADKQSAAADRANNTQFAEYQQTRTDQEPWRQAGATALSQMANPDFQKSFTAADFQQDPGYQFRMQQGQNALERSAAARGGLQNGGTLKALTQYGQNFASNEYQNAYNRFNNDQSQRFNRLSAIAGTGQTANSQLAQAGQNYANQVGNNLTSAGGAQGAAGIASANAWGNTLSGLGKNWMDYTAQRQINNWLTPSSGGSGGGGTYNAPSGPNLGLNLQF